MPKSILRWSLFGFAAFLLTSTADLRPANAQFLEKLEAAVRARLDASQSVQGQPGTPGNASSGELPPPIRSDQPGGEGADGIEIPSILETTENLVPAPIASTSEPAGAIYLGLEAEAAVGGGLGVRVSNVTQGSPAWKAGFKVGDRIKAIQGNAISDLDAMVNELSEKRPGDTLRFFVSRGGRNLELVTVLMDANLATRIASKVDPIVEDEPAWLGITVNDLTPSFRQQFGLSVFRGAAVTSVVPGSPAAKAGIMAGDAIVEVVGRPVEKADDLLAWIEGSKPGDIAQLRVARGFAVQALVLTIEGNPKAQPPMRFGNRVPTTSSPSTAQTPTQLNLAPSEAKPAENPVVAERAPQAPLREQQLEEQVDRLQEELRQAKRQLAETEQKLKEILNVLNKN